MDAKFPVIVRFAAFTIGCLSDGHDQSAGWQRNGATQSDAATVADRLDLCSNRVNVSVLLTCQFNHGYSCHVKSSLSKSIC